MHSFICSTSPAGDFVANFFSAVFVLNLVAFTEYPDDLQIPSLILEMNLFFFVSVYFLCLHP